MMLQLTEIKQNLTSNVHVGGSLSEEAQSPGETAGKGAGHSR